MFLPLLRERAGVRGNRTLAVLATSVLDSAPENGSKGHMTLSHSSFQAFGFTGGRRQGPFPKQGRLVQLRHDWRLRLNSALFKLDVHRKSSFRLPRFRPIIILRSTGNLLHASKFIHPIMSCAEKDIRGSSGGPRNRIYPALGGAGLDEVRARS